MCGICGKLFFREIIPEKDLIHSMCNMILHRGPDDEGLYTAPHIGLGQRRLTIIDLQSNACAPLSNEDKTIWLVFNGEIYNFQDLRKQLIEKGHNFRTNSDTEVIIHLYEEEGVACLQKLRGMFAFALWDSRKKYLFCARDRLGKKPFNYMKTKDFFIFGSEIKAITVDPDVPISPDYHAIDLYLTHQFVPSPVSAFEGIRKLGPGEYLICDLNGDIKIKKFWQPKIHQKTKASYEEIKEELLFQLRQSVRLRMIADVPLGAFLSGGIDSATVVALMAEQSSSPVKTFSIGFEDLDFNELPYARLVAEKYQTEHHEFIVKPNAVDILPMLVKHYNEPFADSSSIPSFYVSKITKQHVTVALSGDGGDESFAGYENYGHVLRWNRLLKMPHNLRKAISSTASEALRSIFPYENLSMKLQRGLKILECKDISCVRLHLASIIKEEEKSFLYTECMKKLLHEKSLVVPLEMFEYIDETDELDWLMRYDQNFYLPDCLAVKMDVASMANSLEVRSPFLDYKFMEFAATIPSSLKKNQFGSKIILKQAVRHLLPESILSKPKTGFGVPLGKWLKTDLAGMMQDVLLDQKARHRGIFKPQAIEKIVSEHIKGKRDWSARLWALLFLELWFREFIDR